MIFSLRKKPNYRSVLFLNQNYYHFYYLAQELRKRGWDALLVNTEDPKSEWSRYYHGEDLNLFSEDPKKNKRNVDRFFREAKKRFELLHFSGDGHFSFYRDRFLQENPKDILKWRLARKKIVYTIAGCNSAVRPTEFAKWGNNPCQHCSRLGKPDECTDDRSLNWGNKLKKFCDLVFLEGYPQIDLLKDLQVYSNPASMCLDEAVWHPDLEIPPAHKINRQPGEILIFHGVGHFNQRSNTSQKNIKGTDHILAVIEKLKREGLPVRIIFVHELQSKDVKYYQHQADIVIDQLHLGRWGANARESLMLGKPTLCYVNTDLGNDSHNLHSDFWSELPFVNVTPATLEEKLRPLITNRELRVKIGQDSRKFALKWFSARACADRYEEVVDKLWQGKSP